jgi:hypothetical protein
MEGGNEENQENQNQIQAPGAAATTPAVPTTLNLAPEVISALVAPVGLKLPEFWPQSTDLWFARADAQFRLKGITVEQTKFDHVISMLDNKTANQCLSILVNPPENPYTALKQKLTKTFSLTKSEKASRIIKMDGLGDRTPSQCLVTMLNLVPEEEEPGFLFRELFLMQLPDQVRTSLAQTTKTGSTREDLEALAEEADRYFRSMGARISAIGVSAFPVAAGLTQAHQSSPTSGLDGWSRDQLVNALSKTLCLAHARYGEKAHSCKSPCSWTGPLAPIPAGWKPRGKPGSRSGNSQPGQGRSQ